MNESVFEIHLQYDRGVVSLPGKTITDAFAKLGLKTRDGNIDFSLLDHYFVHEVTVTPEKIDIIEDQYQLILFEEPGKPIYTKSFSNKQDDLINIVEFKHKMGAYFHKVAIVDVNTEKVVYWE